MNKVWDVTRDGIVTGHAIFCPGCQCVHIFDSRWSYNGNAESPTFGPVREGAAHSMLVNQDDASRRCHSHVTNGIIHFLDDCFHSLKGKTVPLEGFKHETQPAGEEL